ncbi:1-deoxy-D-xylulose 5-phosphate reductoisomerase [Nymphon striatum]|nr:1-deoxy-D-xylulose 5-phosphate reductoisomerase [Nymphon striatum]
MINDIIKDAETRMKKSIDSLRGELAKVRTGRAHPSLLEHIVVDYYGSDTPLSQVASIGVEDARTLTVTPWERPMVQAVEKAIMNSDLGLNPNSAGTVIRIPMPQLTEERRRDLVKVEKEKEISEDEERKGQEEIQKLTDKYVKEIDEVVAVKEEDLMKLWMAMVDGRELSIGHVLWGIRKAVEALRTGNVPKKKSQILMSLFMMALEREAKALARNNVKLQIIGDLSQFSEKLQKKIKQVEELTANSDGLKAFDDITEESISDCVSTFDIPDPDLFIRTGGEKRISNFLIWQMAYTELYFTDVLWPDFDANELNIAIEDYSSRQRRFGKTSEQVIADNLKKSTNSDNKEKALVAMADSGAYFAGKAFGKNKLAPELSPGKTKEGMFGGLLGATILSVFAAWFFELPIQDWIYFIFLSMAVALMSVAGDLFESLMKREVGQKDSGNILPGHGGMNSKKGICILGSTGTIGVNTLDVISRHPEDYEVIALTASESIDDLEKQCLKYNPLFAVMVNDKKAKDLHKRLTASGSATKVLAGKESLETVSTLDEVDYVMAAIVGAAGLLPNLAAAKAGKRIMLANKESLVMSGSLFMDTVHENGAELLPIDSEHNAIFQSMPPLINGFHEKAGVTKILLTGSGGPFRERAIESLVNVTPEQAVAHPNWVMGRKISVDSATMMNKGLEVIETCWLFDVKEDQIQVVIHPESTIHSMVSYNDGSVLAQLGNPDMRTPIAYALGYPQRIESGVRSIRYF